MKQKKSSWLIAVLVIAYLIGIAYLAFSDHRISSVDESEPFMEPTTAPDGTQIKGPTGPPPGSETTGVPGSAGSSGGPTFAPPAPLNQ